MAIYSLQAKDAVIRINDTSALNAIQNFNWDSASNAENLSQLGDANYDSQTITPDVSASFEARTTGSLASFLSRMIYKLNVTTGEFEGYNGVLNTMVIKELDLERAVFDLIESKKANEVYDRSTLIPRAHLKSFSLSAKIDGSATEQYQFESDLLELYVSPQHDIISIPVQRAVGALTTAVLLPVGYDVELDGGTPVATAEWVVIALDIDGIRVEAADLELDTDDATGDTLTLNAAQIAAGVTVPLGSKISVIAYAKVPGVFPVITYPTTARFVKADQIDLWMVSPTATFLAAAQTLTVAGHMAVGTDINAIPFTASDQMLRVQSLDISVDLRREALKEIRRNSRGNAVFYRAATYPLNISISVNTLESDMALWRKMQGKGPTDVLNLADFEGLTWVVVRRDYKKSVVLETIIVGNARVENPGARVQVGGRSEWNFTMTGSQFACQGRAI